METIFSLSLFTIAYGLLILSIFPDRYIRKTDNEPADAPLFFKYAYTMPFVISVLGGYVLAVLVVNFIIT